MSPKAPVKTPSTPGQPIPNMGMMGCPPDQSMGPMLALQPQSGLQPSAPPNQSQGQGQGPQDIPLHYTPESYSTHGTLRSSEKYGTRGRDHRRGDYDHRTPDGYSTTRSVKKVYLWANFPKHSNTPPHAYDNQAAVDSSSSTGGCYSQVVVPSHYSNQLAFCTSASGNNSINHYYSNTLTKNYNIQPHIKPQPQYPVTSTTHSTAIYANRPSPPATTTTTAQQQRPIARPLSPTTSTSSVTKTHSNSLSEVDHRTSAQADTKCETQSPTNTSTELYSSNSPVGGGPLSPSRTNKAPPLLFPQHFLPTSPSSINYHSKRKRAALYARPSSQNEQCYHIGTLPRSLQYYSHKNTRDYPVSGRDEASILLQPLLQPQR